MSGRTTNVLVSFLDCRYGYRTVPQARVRRFDATREGVLRASWRCAADGDGGRGLYRGLGLVGEGPGLGWRCGLVRARDVRLDRRVADGPRDGARPRPDRPG